MLRFLKPGFAKAMFGPAVLVSWVISPVVLADEMPLAASRSAVVAGEEDAFLEKNEAAMMKMMNDMTVRPAGDIDKDFVAMMIPHHQGAIDMAVLELRYGTNEQLRRIAQEIIVDQMQEIAAMRLAVGETAPVSLPAPTQSAPVASQQDDMQMPKDMGMSPSPNKEE